MIANVRALLYGAAALAAASGCSGGFSWPGVCGSETVNRDTWQVRCGCIRQSGTGPVYAADWNFCFDGDPILLELENRCDAAAWDLTGRLGLGTPSDPIVCEPVIGSQHVIARDNCPVTVGASCEELSSSSSPLLDPSAAPPHGWENPFATYVGFVDTSRSWVQITVRGETAWPEVDGEVFITGGDCPGETCDMQVDGLDLWTTPFSLHGLTVDEVALSDWGAWSGVKRADDTYKFSVDDARLKLSASVDGDRGAIVGKPIGIPGGQFYGASAPLPGGGIAPNGYMTIEGTFTLDEGEARVFLVLPFGTGAPRVDVSATYVTCDVAGAPECGWVFDASWSRSFEGGPVSEFEWFDAAGNRIGTGPRIAPDSLYVPTPITYPLTVYVTDAGGRTGSKQVGSASPPPAERTGEHGWVWANLPTSASYTPSAGYQYNSAGDTNIVTRSGVGAYQVRFAGIGGGGGTVHVTAYGGDSAYCKSAGWYASGDDLLANVRCYDAAGAPEDALFNALFARETNVGAEAGTTAYLWANASSSADYAPSAAYSYNDTGAINRVRRTSAGVYTAELPGMGDHNASVQVTAYGGAAERCKVGGWWRSSAAAFVTVYCTDAAGTPRDAQFTLSYVAGGVLALDTDGAYAWASNATSADYTPSASYQHNDLSSTPLRARRVGTGNYRVDIPRDAPVSRDTVQVVSYGTGGDYCKAGGWSRGASTTTVTIRCFAPNGTARDSLFNLAYLTH